MLTKSWVTSSCSYRRDLKHTHIISTSKLLVLVMMYIHVHKQTYIHTYIHTYGNIKDTIMNMYASLWNMRTSNDDINNIIKYTSSCILISSPASMNLRTSSSFPPSAASWMVPEGLSLLEPLPLSYLAIQDSYDSSKSSWWDKCETTMRRDCNSPIDVYIYIWINRQTDGSIRMVAMIISNEWMNESS